MPSCRRFVEREDRVAIRDLYRNGMSVSKMTVKYKCSESTIRTIINNNYTPPDNEDSDDDYLHASHTKRHGQRHSSHSNTKPYGKSEKNGRVKATNRNESNNEMVLYDSGIADGDKGEHSDPHATVYYGLNATISHKESRTMGQALSQDHGPEMDDPTSRRKITDSRPLHRIETRGACATQTSSREESEDINAFLTRLQVPHLALLFKAADFKTASHLETLKRLPKETLDKTLDKLMRAGPMSLREWSIIRGELVKESDTDVYSF